MSTVYPTIPYTFFPLQIISSSKTNANNSALLNGFTSGGFTHNALNYFIQGVQVIDSSRNISANNLNISGAFNLTGNFSVDTNVFFVNATTDRVGILTATPSFPLDVAGNVRIQGSNYLSFGGTGLGDNDMVISRSAAGVLMQSALNATSSDFVVQNTHITGLGRLIAQANTNGQNAQVIADPVSNRARFGSTSGANTWINVYSNSIKFEMAGVGEGVVISNIGGVTITPASGTNLLLTKPGSETVLTMGDGSASSYTSSNFRGNSVASDAILSAFYFLNNQSSSSVESARIAIVHEGASSDNKGAILLYTNNGVSSAERLRLNSAGQLGIGTTAFFPLDVAGNVRIQGSNSLSFGGTTGSGNDVSIARSGAATATLTGTLAGTFTGTGTGLTLNASNLTTGTVPNAAILGTNLPAANLTGTVPNAAISGSYSNFTDITASGIILGVTLTGTISTAAQPNITSVGTLTSLSSSGTISGNLFSGSGASLTNLNASNLASGTVPNAVISGAYSNFTDITASTLTLSTQPRASVYFTVDVPISATTWTTFSFNSENFDDGGCHSTVTNTSRLTAPQSGTYLIVATASIQNTGTPDDLGVRIRLNGTTIISETDTQSVTTIGLSANLNTSVIFQLNANDYVEMQAYVSAPKNALNTLTVFSMDKLN